MTHKQIDVIAQALGALTFLLIAATAPTPWWLSPVYLLVTIPSMLFVRWLLRRP